MSESCCCWDERHKEMLGEHLLLQNLPTVASVSNTRIHSNSHTHRMNPILASAATAGGTTTCATESR